MNVYLVSHKTCLTKQWLVVAPDEQTAMILIPYEDMLALAAPFKDGKWIGDPKKFIAGFRIEKINGTISASEFLQRVNQYFVPAYRLPKLLSTSALKAECLVTLEVIKH